MVKEAEKCFIDVQNSVPFCEELGSKETEIRTSEDWFLHYRDKAVDRSDRSSSVTAQVMDHWGLGTGRGKVLDQSRSARRVVQR